MPMAYVYPTMRSTRDLLRRRMHFVRERADLLTHIQQTNHQYNLPNIGKTFEVQRQSGGGVAERFEDASVRKTVETDLELIASYDTMIRHAEWHPNPQRQSARSGKRSIFCKVFQGSGRFCRWSFSTRFRISPGFPQSRILPVRPVDLSQEKRLLAKTLEAATAGSGTAT